MLRLVEETEGGEIEPVAYPPIYGAFMYKRVATRLTAHSIYKCSHCGARVVTERGKTPPEKCGKCKL